MRTVVAREKVWRMEMILDFCFNSILNRFIFKRLSLDFSIIFLVCVFSFNITVSIVFSSKPSWMCVHFVPFNICFWHLKPYDTHSPFIILMVNLVAWCVLDLSFISIIISLCHVQIKDFTFFTLNNGKPQGSILNLVYIFDYIQVLLKCWLCHMGFILPGALMIFRSVVSLTFPTEVSNCISACLTAVSCWTFYNFLTLNTDNLVVLLIGSDSLCYTVGSDFTERLQWFLLETRVIVLSPTSCFI